VKRYSPAIRMASEDCEMFEDPQGEWVRFDDKIRDDVPPGQATLFYWKGEELRWATLAPKNGKIAAEDLRRLGHYVLKDLHESPDPR